MQRCSGASKGFRGWFSEVGAKLARIWLAKVWGKKDYSSGQSLCCKLVGTAFLGPHGEHESAIKAGFFMKLAA